MKGMEGGWRGEREWRGWGGWGGLSKWRLEFRFLSSKVFARAAAFISS